MEKGYHDVRPLLGGFDGWVELGYPTEPVDAPADRLTSVAEAGSPA